MGTRLQRNLSSVRALTAGQYTTETATARPAIACPGCGGISDLDFAVYRDGRVSQIWSCPYACCSFLDYLDLDAWGEDVLV